MVTFDPSVFLCDSRTVVCEWKKIKNKLWYFGYKVPPYDQGCALAEPGGPWRLTFALGRLENQIFHTNHMLGTLDFTGYEHWAPLNFP